MHGDHKNNDDDETEMKSATLPSELYEEYKKRRSDDDEEIDYDDLLQNLLSVLSTLDSTLPSTLNDRQTDTTAGWLWERLTQPSLSGDEEGDDLSDSAKQEWSTGLQYLHTLLPNISSPFELHSIASQSILMSEEFAPRHYMLCLLLCARALQLCPVARPMNRWKRWQSITCETVCLFQNSSGRLAMTAGGEGYSHQSRVRLVVDLWTNFLAPACLHVVQVLPPDAYHVALFAGLVGTTVATVDDVVIKARSLLEGPLQWATRSLYETIQSICNSRPEGASNLIYYSELTIWRNPRSRNEAIDSRTVNVDRENEDFVFWIHQNDLSWWTHRHDKMEPEERLAHMDTNWSEDGISLVASVAFHDRALVYHPVFVWEVWFPHVAILLKASLSFEDWQLTFLQRLLEVTPKHSLSTDTHKHDNSRQARFDSPLQVFQLLANRMMIRQPTTTSVDDYVHDPPQAPIEEQQMLEFRKRSERFVGLMKLLLSRYTTTCQVQIVETLIRDCPSPGFQARFLDLLRPILFDDSCQEKLGTFLTSVLAKYLYKHWSKSRQEIVDIEDLIQNVEVSVGAITMIQLWCMVRGKTLPHGFEDLEATFEGFHHSLQKRLECWSKPATTKEALATHPPDECHRLFLLESALQTVLDVLNREGGRF